MTMQDQLPASSRRERSRRYLWFIPCGMVLFSLIALMVLVVFLSDMKSFADRTALLVEISPSGEISLEYDGQPITGRLAGVTWQDSENYYRQVQQLTVQAKRDKVEWSQGEEGLQIWYLNGEGERILLNNQIIAIR